MRIFFSVSIEMTGEMEALLRRLAGMGRGIRAVREEKLHLTLKFLGEVKADFVPLLEGILDEVVSRHPCFDLILEGMGVFPNERQPRIVWVGVKENAALNALVDDLQTACQGPGFERDQYGFNPHITVARCQAHHSREMKALIEEYESTVFATQRVSTVQLTQSMLEEQPVRYRMMREGALKGREES